MVKTHDFVLTLKLNDVDVELDNTLFDNFIIYEILHYGIYFASIRLLMKTSNLREYPFMTGNNLQITIVINDEDFIYDFIIYKNDIQDEYVVYHLMPKIYIKLGLQRLNRGYEGKLSSVISDIASLVGITDTEIKSTSVASRKFLQLNQSYFHFIKQKIEQSYTNNSNYVFFIDKTNKLKFYSLQDLKSKKEISTISNNYIDDIKINDNTFSYQLMSGFGATGYYFDWDDGSIIETKFDETKFKSLSANSKLTDKLGVFKEYISEKNKLVMLNPVAKDFLPDKKYNEVELENIIMRKNLFNIFFEFDSIGNINLTPIEQIKIFFNSTLLEFSDIYDGNWCIYSAIHFLSTEGFSTKLTISNPFFHGINSSNYL